MNETKGYRKTKRRAEILRVIDEYEIWWGARWNYGRADVAVHCRDIKARLEQLWREEDEAASRPQWPSG